MTVAIIRTGGAEFLGPAALAYLDPAEFRAWHGGALTTPVQAVAHAIQAGKLPQWRARPQASRRAALALRFRELGSQVSIYLDTAVGSLPRLR